MLFGEGWQGVILLDKLLSNAFWILVILLSDNYCICIILGDPYTHTHTDAFKNYG